MKEKILSIAFCVAVITVATSTTSFAQTVSMDDIKAQMVKDWERAKAYTAEYLNTMPADKYGFRPTDSMRSFAQQMLHIAAANVFLMSNTTDKKVPGWLSFTIEQRASAQQKDSVVYYVNNSYDYCIDAVKSSDMSKWGEKKKLFGRFEETKFAIINKTFEHQGHHRGQTTVYIRLQGVKPPEEKLF